LAEVGIESKIYEAAPNRCNVIARIKGSDSLAQDLLSMATLMLFQQMPMIGLSILLGESSKME
jgi:hypothetical protein